MVSLVNLISFAGKTVGEAEAKKNQNKKTDYPLKHWNKINHNTHYKNTKLMLARHIRKFCGYNESSRNITGVNISKRTNFMHYFYVGKHAYIATTIHH